MPQNFVRAHRMFPLVGALIGAAVGSALPRLARSSACPISPRRRWRSAPARILTGALHEDGLADVADGFGGGRDSAAKLEIMRDSRLGTYGALILLVSFCRKAFRAGGDSGWLCRARPDRRPCAGARRAAGDVDEPALCAQGRPCRAMPASPIARRRRSPRSWRLLLALLSLSLAQCAAVRRSWPA